MPPRARPQAKELSLEQRITNIERLLKWLGGFSGLSLVVLLAFAYFLGGISTKVSNSEQAINKLAADVSGRDGLLVRTSLIESHLNSISTTLSSMNATLESVRIQTLRENNTVTIRPVPSPTPAPNQR